MSKPNPKILIFEDNITVADSIATALRKQSYEVFLLKSGIDGIKQIHNIMPSLILLEINISGVDGYELLAHKQSDAVISSIPVFLLSTQGIPVNMKNIPEDSVLEFVVTLHSDPTDIVTKVNRHFDRNNADKSLSSDDFPKKKVLWAEDDKLIGAILSKKLISSGFELFHVKNGEQALETIKTTIPDVIVLDLLLPGMSGFDILQEIRVDERFKNTPVIILSNLSKPSDIEKANILGVKKFLVKATVSLDDIVGEVKKMCK